MDQLNIEPLNPWRVGRESNPQDYPDANQVQNHCAAGLFEKISHLHVSHFSDFHLLIVHDRFLDTNKSCSPFPSISDDFSTKIVSDYHNLDVRLYRAFIFREKANPVPIRWSPGLFAN